MSLKARDATGLQTTNYCLLTVTDMAFGGRSIYVFYIPDPQNQSKRKYVKLSEP